MYVSKNFHNINSFEVPCEVSLRDFVARLLLQPRLGLFDDQTHRNPLLILFNPPRDQISSCYLLLLELHHQSVNIVIEQHPHDLHILPATLDQLFLHYFNNTQLSLLSSLLQLLLPSFLIILRNLRFGWPEAAFINKNAIGSALIMVLIFTI